MRMNIFDKPNDQSDARIGSGMARKGRTKSKHKDLQPWIDYFRMLQTQADKGLLLMKAGDHEAYITQPCLHAITPGDDPTAQVQSGAILDTARHIRAYAACINAHAEGLSTYDPAVVLDPDAPLPVIPTEVLAAYQQQPFALNVVQPDAPNDPLYTILLTQVRQFFRTREKVEVITYDDKPKEP